MVPHMSQSDVRARSFVRARTSFVSSVATSAVASANLLSQAMSVSQARDAMIPAASHRLVVLAGLLKAKHLGKAYRQGVLQSLYLNDISFSSIRELVVCLSLSQEAVAKLIQEVENYSGTTEQSVNNIGQSVSATINQSSPLILVDNTSALLSAYNVVKSVLVKMVNMMAMDTNTTNQGAIEAMDIQSKGLASKETIINQVFSQISGGYCCMNCC